jgi:hypothetical protein
MVAVGLGVWAISRGGDEEPGAPPPAREASASTMDAPELAEGHKPHCDSCLDGGPVGDRIALERPRLAPHPTMPTQEPPPDTLDPPLGDAGRPPLPPPPLPDDIEVTTPEALRARQEESVRTIEARLVQVERALERAEQGEETGNIDVLRHRRDQLSSRRDRLRQVIANREADIHRPAP